jgi:hypothetical protein
LDGVVRPAKDYFPSHYVRDSDAHIVLILSLYGVLGWTAFFRSSTLTLILFRLSAISLF